MGRRESSVGCLRQFSGVSKQAFSASLGWTALQETCAAIRPRRVTESFIVNDAECRGCLAAVVLIVILVLMVDGCVKIG